MFGMRAGILQFQEGEDGEGGLEQVFISRMKPCRKCRYWQDSHGVDRCSKFPEKAYPPRLILSSEYYKDGSSKRLPDRYEVEQQACWHVRAVGKPCSFFERVGRFRLDDLFKPAYRITKRVPLRLYYDHWSILWVPVRFRKRAYDVVYPLLRIRRNLWKYLLGVLPMGLCSSQERPSR